MNVAGFKYGCKILLHHAQHGASDPELMHFWDCYNYELYCKWQWYFRYRQALLQVQHPKRYVELVPFKYPYVPPKDQLIKRLQDKLRAAKSNHTQLTNKINLAKDHWNQLFPIEDDPDYIWAMEKVNQKYAIIQDLEQRLRLLKTNEE